MNTPRPALLALEDGTVFRGTSFGADVTSHGEVCFNTSMTGYQEILTDPSYRGQIVAMTYPEIGNYGINPVDVESERPQAAGFVVRNLAARPSNWRSQESLEAYLARHEVPGIADIDTRALTRLLRTKGALRGVITTQELKDAAAVELARSWNYLGRDFVQEVTCATAYDWDPDGSLSADWMLPRGEATLASTTPALPPVRWRIAAVDYGIKRNILRRLRQFGFGVRVYPASASSQEILSTNPDGVFLSNGPGDPEALTSAHQTVRALIGQKPIFGICLGHQLLAFALGGRTFKLKFGHRGGNQPVKDLPSGRVLITSQNHGFAIDCESLPKDQVEFTQFNLNDKTCEGMRHRHHPILAVQYHPEASPGPHDATGLFAKFAGIIESNKS
jgi:carbamoyl-phosphate synthase small subunit